MNLSFEKYRYRGKHIQKVLLTVKYILIVKIITVVLFKGAAITLLDFVVFVFIKCHEIKIKKQKM